MCHTFVLADQVSFYILYGFEDYGIQVNGMADTLFTVNANVRKTYIY